MSPDGPAGTLALATLRTAIETHDKIANFKGELPYFVHKWTKQRRHYVLNDLNLPDRVFLRGIWPNERNVTIAIGGTRTPTVETFCLVARVTRALATAGVVIISGGVPGVDLAAHLAAIDSDEKGSSIAVLANPVDLGFCGHEWYNSFVEARFLKRGAFISEYDKVCDVFSSEYCERLLARDRIISGLCDVFLAFECSEDSATVDTVHRAILQGKPVLCIESIAKTARRGIDQLRHDFALRVLSERHLSATDIATEVLKVR